MASVPALRTLIGIFASSSSFLLKDGLMCFVAHAEEGGTVDYEEYKVFLSLSLAQLLKVGVKGFGAGLLFST
jgi:hypothetical protein